MGVLGAFVFAAQMLNFAIPGTGSSGHLAGGMLLAAVLGPASAFVVMTSVVLVQCLLLGDGGLLALGANVFNLGFFPCFIGYPLYRWLAGAAPSPSRRSLALGAGALLSVELGALSVAIETVASGMTPLRLRELGALMVGIHFPIAIAEALVTAVAAAMLWRLKPTAVAAGPAPTERVTGLLLAASLCAALGATVAVWFASPRPDGLEWALSRTGGAAAVQQREPAQPWPAVSAQTSAQGLGGAAVVLLMCAAIGVTGVLVRRRRSAATRRAA